ncbi:MAG: LysR family hydrogen peroxide-inducible transcriptional activator [Hyphomicrobiaceae bacterium]|jgi:LysR family hydrogen peroxide-inducible transcriptional activator
MDFRQIRYFLALAGTLNFTRAAEQCNVTQPTLTNAIKRLEEELGGELIHRDGKDSRLTKLGQTLRAQFEKIEETRTSLKRTAQEFASGEGGELNIGVMCTVGPIKLAKFLDEFQMQNSKIKLYLHDVTPSSISQLLLTSALDGAFCAGQEGQHSRLSYLPLYREPMVVAFRKGHMFADLNHVPLEVVMKERYIDRLHCEFRDSVLTFADQESISMDVVFSSQREDWIQSMVREGIGVSVLPKFSLMPPVLDNRPISGPTLERQVEFAFAKNTNDHQLLAGLIDRATHYLWT